MMDKEITSLLIENLLPIVSSAVIAIVGKGLHALFRKLGASIDARRAAIEAKAADEERAHVDRVVQEAVEAVEQLSLTDNSSKPETKRGLATQIVMSDKRAAEHFKRDANASELGRKIESHVYKMKVNNGTWAERQARKARGGNDGN